MYSSLTILWDLIGVDFGVTSGIILVCIRIIDLFLPPLLRANIDLDIGILIVWNGLEKFLH